jgi:hypothetical protein
MMRPGQQLETFGVAARQVRAHRQPLEVARLER